VILKRAGLQYRSDSSLESLENLLELILTYVSGFKFLIHLLYTYQFRLSAAEPVILRVESQHSKQITDASNLSHFHRASWPLEQCRASKTQVTHSFVT
jgi:hypothetical protein